MDVNPKQRRRHGAAFKAQVLAACAELGASVAAVALSFGLNDNLVHQWRRDRGASPAPPPASATVKGAREFVELSWRPVPSRSNSAHGGPREGLNTGRFVWPRPSDSGATPLCH